MALDPPTTPEHAAPPGAAPVGLNDAERAYHHIRRAIVEGVYPPGHRLVEQQLSSAVDVSRTPIREALRRLASEGLIVTERNRGARVRALDVEGIADLYEVRSRLEAYAAELAAVRADDAAIAGLLHAAERFADVARAIRTDESGRADDRGHRRVEAVRRLEDANSDFHLRIVEASQHERILALIVGCVDTPLVFQALRRFRDDEVERSALFHRLIAEAIAGREPERAGRLMAEHILQGRDSLLAHLDQPLPMGSDPIRNALTDRTSP